MPASTDYIIKQPLIKGVDLNAEARITNPGAYKFLQNLYAKQPGFITVRPGSELVSRVTVIPGKDPGGRTPPDGGTVTKWSTALTNLKNAQPAQSTYNGEHPLWGTILDAGASAEIGRSMPVYTAQTSQTAGMYISGLARVWHPRLNRAYWVGAIHRNAGEGGDFFFFLNDSDEMQAIPMENDLLISSGMDWSFLVMNSNKDDKDDEAFLTDGLMCFMTNGRGRPLGIFDPQDSSSR
jgi:hypothetical protein